MMTMNESRPADWRTTVVTVMAGAILCGCAPAPVSTSPQSMLTCDHDALEAGDRRRGPALVADAYDSVTDVPLDAVTVLDGALHRAVVTQSLYSERNEAGTTTVTARFANCTDEPIQMRARTSFLRSSGAPAESASAWKTVFIDPRAMNVYQEHSMSNAGVENFIIEISPAN